jgi:hypothetical protein
LIGFLAAKANNTWRFQTSKKNLASYIILFFLDPSKPSIINSPNREKATRKIELSQSNQLLIEFAELFFHKIIKLMENYCNKPNYKSINCWKFAIELRIKRKNRKIAEFFINLFQFYAIQFYNINRHKLFFYIKKWKK